MTVKLEDLKLFPGETEKKSDTVFLEKAAQPSSENGEGIPRGVLRLTNRRIFFLSTGIGKDKPVLEEGTTSILSIGLAVASAYFPNVEKISEIGPKISEFADRYGGKRLKNMEQALNSGYSFVVPLERIVGCRKFPIFNGSITNYLGSSVKLWFGDRWFRSHYVELNIKNDIGLTETFCIYCNGPRHPEDYRSNIDVRGWCNKIKKQLPNI